MREAALNSSTFPTALCKTCGKTVLTYVSLIGENTDQRACVHCDSPVDSALRWVTADELTADGYEIGPQRAPRTGGCGSGCSCSTRGH